ncbi:MAG: hypothetical protein U0324_30300 [Polyangiales bacterium]
MTFWQRFMKDAHVLVAEGFSRLAPSTLTRDDEERISERIEEGVYQWYEASGRPEWARRYAVVTEVREPGGSRTGKRRKRIDIRIESNEGVGRPPRFLFEAKRFYHRSDCVAEYVGTDGLGGFLAGDYARDALHAGMLGYVQKGTNLASIQKVEAKLSNERSTHGLAAQGPVWSTQCLDARLGDTYVSQHTRQQSLPSITLYHSFLRCCP